MIFYVLFALISFGANAQSCVEFPENTLPDVSTLLEDDQPVFGGRRRRRLQNMLDTIQDELPFNPDDLPNPDDFNPDDLPNPEDFLPDDINLPNFDDIELPNLSVDEVGDIFPSNFELPNFSTIDIPDLSAVEIPFSIPDLSIPDLSFGDDFPIDVPEFSVPEIPFSVDFSDMNNVQDVVNQLSIDVPQFSSDNVIGVVEEVLSTDLPDNLETLEFPNADNLPIPDGFDPSIPYCPTNFCIRVQTTQSDFLDCWNPDSGVTALIASTTVGSANLDTMSFVPCDNVQIDCGLNTEESSGMAAFFSDEDGVGWLIVKILGVAVVGLGLVFVIFKFCQNQALKKQLDSFEEGTSRPNGTIE